MGLWVTKQHRDLDTLIYVGEVEELTRLEATDTHLEIGAAVTYTDAMDALAAHWPDFGELIRRLGSVQIRNSGTIGGNVANGSPIGNSMPALIALGAEVVLRKGRGAPRPAARGLLPRLPQDRAAARRVRRADPRAAAATGTAVPLL